MVNIHLGQAWDIYWHGSKDIVPTEDQYFQMVSFKTGVMFRMAAAMILTVLK
jgi:geranylgeranyl pyrophosphate synthase